LKRRALELVDALSRRHGSAFASERRMRELLGQKGRRPGERSTSRVLRKAAREGLIRRTRVYRGGVLPTGRISNYGTTINVLISRQERRAAARARAKAARRKASPPPRSVPRESIPGPGEEQVTFEEWRARSELELPDEVRAMLRVVSHGVSPPIPRK
jgi:hypothetical protein